MEQFKRGSEISEGEAETRFLERMQGVVEATSKYLQALPERKSEIANLVESQKHLSYQDCNRICSKYEAENQQISDLNRQIHDVFKEKEDLRLQQIEAAWQKKYDALEEKYNKGLDQSLQSTQTGLEERFKKQLKELQQVKDENKVLNKTKQAQEMEIQQLKDKNNVLEDICLEMKRKSLGIFGRRMGERQAELDKMKSKMQNTNTERGFFNRMFRRTTRDGGANAVDIPCVEVGEASGIGASADAEVDDIADVSSSNDDSSYDDSSHDDSSYDDSSYDDSSNDDSSYDDIADVCSSYDDSSDDVDSWTTPASTINSSISGSCVIKVGISSIQSRGIFDRRTGERQAELDKMKSKMQNTKTETGFHNGAFRRMTHDGGANAMNILCVEVGEASGIGVSADAAVDDIADVCCSDDDSSHDDSNYDDIADVCSSDDDSSHDDSSYDDIADVCSSDDDSSHDDSDDVDSRTSAVSSINSSISGGDVSGGNISDYLPKLDLCLSFPWMEE